MKQTVLGNAHKYLNASMGAFAGWDMPLSYASVKEEVLAVRRKAGLFDVSHMGEFLLEGRSALDLLRYLCTQDCATLSVGKGMYGLLLNEEGGAIDDLIVYRLAAEQWLLCVNAGNIEKDEQWILKQLKALTPSVCFKNISEQTALLALQGPASWNILKEWLAPSEWQQLMDAPQFSIFRAHSIHEQCWIAKTGYTGGPGVEIFMPQELAVLSWNRLTNLGALPCGLVARDTLRIEACLPLYGQELNETLTPLESGVNWAVHRKLNRYFCGKEALELQRKNKTQKRTQLKIILPAGAGVARAKQELFYQGKVVGEITSGTFSPVLECSVAMASFDLTKGIAPSVPLELNIRGRMVAVKTTAKKFYSL